MLLFKGLWLYGCDYRWQKFPIVHISFGRQKAQKAEELKRFIHAQTDIIAAQYEISLQREDYYLRFEELFILSG